MNEQINWQVDKRVVQAKKQAEIEKLAVESGKVSRKNQEKGRKRALKWEKKAVRTCFFILSHCVAH